MLRIWLCIEPSSERPLVSNLSGSPEQCFFSGVRHNPACGWMIVIDRKHGWPVEVLVQLSDALGGSPNLREELEPILDRMFAEPVALQR